MVLRGDPAPMGPPNICASSQNKLLLSEHNKGPLHSSLQTPASVPKLGSFLPLKSQRPARNAKRAPPPFPSHCIVEGVWASRWRLPFVCKYLDPLTHPPTLLEDPFCTLQMTSGSSHPAIAANGCKDSLRPEVDLFLTVPY